ncbi:MAG: flagellar biosynthetic protein FliR [Myxococcota bacterium]|nr:flagellar biosynthetic protein FliR [Myxococcota bacterium]
MIEVMTTALLVFARIAGLMRVLPVLSMAGTPKLFLLLSGFAITLAVLPIVPVAPLSATLGVLVFGVMGEILLGVLLGSIVQAIFASMTLAGEVMANQMSFAMATLFNPLMKGTDSTIGTICNWLAGLVFLGIGLHFTCIGIVAESFQVIPPGAVAEVFKGMEFFVDAVSTSILIGVKLSGPVLILVWLVQIFVAILTKMAPRMNVYFSVGITLVNVAGLGLLGLSLPFILQTHGEAMVNSTRVMVEAVKAMI